jgi:uncharacterized Zn finger protein
MNDEMDYIRENDYDVCPECGNRANNSIVLASQNPDKDGGSVECAKCGICWKIQDAPEEQN